MEDRHWWFLGRRRIFASLLDRHLPATDPSASVLDVGTGTGAALDYLSSYGRVKAIDGDPTAVEYCRERGVGDVMEASVPPIPLEDGRFSLVTGLDVVEHVDDDGGLVSEMARVLRPGGYCLVSVPAFRSLWSRHDDLAHHRRRYRKAELVRLVEGAGFETIEAHYFNFLLFPPIAAVRWTRRALGGGGSQDDFQARGGYGRLNRLLAAVFGSEASLLGRFSPPFGVSILILARKPETG
jgi:SAM-dependent methyltransferase